MPLLLEHFLRGLANSLDKDVRGISPEALDTLLDYSWPGNIRELQNVLRQALLNTVGPVLLPESLPSNVANHRPVAGEDTGGFDLTGQIDGLLSQPSENLYEQSLTALERYVLPRVLSKTQGNISHSAKLLGITRGSLRNKLCGLRAVHRPANQDRGAQPKTKMTPIQAHKLPSGRHVARCLPRFARCPVQPAPVRPSSLAGENRASASPNRANSRFARRTSTAMPASSPSG